MKMRGKKSFIVMIAAALLFASAPAAAFAEEGTEAVSGSPKTVKQEYILTAESSLTRAALPDYVKEMCIRDR